MRRFTRIVLSLALLSLPAVAATSGALDPTVAAAAPAVPPGGPYWSGWDIARGVSVTPDGQALFILDGYGGLHGLGIGGPAPARPSGGPYWPGWDIARGLAMRDASSGWILDAFGAVHPFGGAPTVTGLPYHSGVDSARGIARAANGGIYVFERGGAVRYGTPVGGSAPPVLAYAPNLVPPVGADITALSDGSGALALDGFGGIHHLGVPSVVPRADGPWWGGWDIGRGIAALPDRTGGFVLDGFGGLHPFTLGNGLPQVNVSTFMSGLSNPWDLSFAPDGHIVYTERPNGISVANGDGSGRHLLLRPSDLLVASEAGAMGMAMDPAFASNRRIYVCYASRAVGRSDDVRLVRYQVNGDWSGLNTPQTILTGLPINAIGELGRHSGCRPRFGPDGFLWVGTGDSAVGTVPQDLHSLGGKILRIDTNGAPAPGNPVPPGGDARIYSYGHRNVQGIAFAPGNPSWVGISVEHGSDRDDELNRIVGGNFGWDPIPGYNESRPMTDLARFPGAVPAVWSSGFPTIAPSGGTFLSGSRWHAWNGRLATGVLKDKHLRVFQVRSDGSIGVITDRMADGVRLRTPVQGPDGFLYVTTDARPGGDQILRVEPN